jgi:hypothetical protein
VAQFVCQHRFKLTPIQKARDAHWQQQQRPQEPDNARFKKARARPNPNRYAWNLERRA